MHVMHNPQSMGDWIVSEKKVIAQLTRADPYMILHECLFERRKLLDWGLSSLWQRTGLGGFNHVWLAIFIWVLSTDTLIAKMPKGAWNRMLLYAKLSLLEAGPCTCFGEDELWTLAKQKCCDNVTSVEEKVNKKCAILMSPDGRHLVTQY